MRTDIVRALGAVSGAVTLILCVITLFRVIAGIGEWGQPATADKSQFAFGIYLLEALMAGAALALMVLAVRVGKATSQSAQQQWRHIGVVGIRSPRGPVILAAVGAAFGASSVATLISRCVSDGAVFQDQTIMADWPQGLLMGARASLLEELVDLVVLLGIPAALAVKFFGFQTWSRRSKWVAVVVAVAVSAAVRGAQHIYQGDYRLFITFGLGVVWGAVFVWCRSVWPIVAAHFFNNFWYAMFAPSVIVPNALIAAVAGVAAWIWFRRVKRDELTT